jgi:hypothetical protein
MTFTMGDMSDPGTLAMKTDIVAFYIGGMTPHVWTATQLNQQTARYRLPIWVYGNTSGTDGGMLDGTKCVNALHSLGVPSGVRVCIDMETGKDVAYVTEFQKVLTANGFNTHYKVVDYGSKDFVYGNPQEQGGYWVADWTGSAHLVSGSWATQWQAANGTGNPNPWDISEVSTVDSLWDIHAPVVMHGVVVSLPNGLARNVRSTNGGATWF